MLSNYFLMFAATVAVTLLLRQAAPRFGLVDQPSGHRVHKHPTPLVGGVAIFTGFFFGILATDMPLSAFRALFLGSGILVFVGVLDDVRELSSTSRFMAQIAAALVMIHFGGVILVDLGDLVGSGGLFLVAFGGLVWVADASTSRTDQPLLIMIMLGVACFLLFNVRLGIRRRATIFLGDAGSMFLGFVLCWFLVRYSQPPFDYIDPVTALWLMAVPLIDTVSIMLRRIFQRRSPFGADRTHLHHLLLHAGCGVNQTLLILLAIAAAGVVFGIGTQHAGWSEPSRFYVFMTLFGAHLLATGRYVHVKGLNPDR